VSAPAEPAIAGGPVALVILDGWGIAPEGPGNAVALADTPTFDALVGGAALEVESFSGIIAAGLEQVAGAGV
jgi:bisphosphoglycerate-independent phosphoglycerate mutase (AlkP superfamily)